METFILFHVSPLNIDNFSLLMPFLRAFCWRTVLFTLKVLDLLPWIKKFGILDTAGTVHWWNPLQLEGPTTYAKLCASGILPSECLLLKIWSHCNFVFCGTHALIFSLHDWFLSNERLALWRTSTFLTFSCMTTVIEMLLMLYGSKSIYKKSTVIYLSPLSIYLLSLWVYFGATQQVSSMEMFDLDKYLIESHIRSSKLMWV